MDAVDVQDELDPMLLLQSEDAAENSEETAQPSHASSFTATSGGTVVTYTFDDLDKYCFFGATFSSVYHDLEFADSRQLARCSLGGGIALLPVDLAQFNSGGVARNLIKLPAPAMSVSIEASDIRDLGPRHFVAYDAAGDEIDRATYTTSSETVQLTLNGTIHQVAIIDYQAQTYWDNLKVTYGAPTEPPLADAGPDQQIIVTESATLGVSAASAQNADMLMYEWIWTEMPDGSQVAFSDPSSAEPTFTADRPGTYAARLIVNNGLLDSEPDEVLIEVLSASGAVIALGIDVSAVQKAGTLNTGQSKSLLKMLELVQRKLHTDSGAALQKLNAFTGHVLGLIDDGVLSPEDGHPLIRYADRISAVIEKQSGHPSS